MDLLTPTGSADDWRRNYVHQLKQTINAYLPSFIFIGEALQNALDAVREAGGGAHHSIQIEMDFDERRVTVTDTGPGFPDKPSLLFLGGGDKLGKGLNGLVGVGLKVVLFSSSHFELRATNASGSVKVEVANAHTFANDPPPTLELPISDHLEVDPTPLVIGGTGTRISYTFPDADGIPEQHLRDVYERCLKDRAAPFMESLSAAVAKGVFASRLTALIASDLRRYSYLGATAPDPRLKDVKISVRLKGDPDRFGPLKDLADGVTDTTFDLVPEYLTVASTLPWHPNPKPHVASKDLGQGGTNITSVTTGFNVTRYSTADEYDSLLVNARGKLSPEAAELRRLLYPKMKSITLTLGRIPLFLKYLPGGSQRVISARGVVTMHDLPITSGRNQQYLHVFDAVVDVDADLNYGKTQLVDMHLVAKVRQFINEAYRATIQTAAQNYVGTIKDVDDSPVIFWERADLGVPALAARKVPADENDVIGLMFELTGLGHFPEFHWYGMSQYDPYDSRAIIKLASDDERLHTKPRQSDLKIVEFKLRGASIARDFDRGDKRMTDVHLIICYEVGESPVPSYQVVELAASETGRGPREPYPGVTHVLYDTVMGKEVQILPLKQFIAEKYAPASPPEIPEEVVEAD